MHDTLIAQIQNFTLEARAALETETGQQLEGIYGWLPDGRFGDTARYPAVNEIAETAESRRRLEAYAEEEKTAGLSPKDARIKLVRETAFTWLNRLVALRMMEERRIIKSTVGKLDKSNSFIFWLTADGNEGMYALHQKGALPQNAMGEGPSDAAYREFLLWQCAQLARDVSVLFDPDNLSSRLFPRPPVLKKIVESTNRQELSEAWQAGNEETVGWVYEGFIEEENKAVFEKFGKGKKVNPDEIGPATQRFTPRWIVRYLVENSLGRLWIEIHPDSRLNEKLGYLVPTQRIEHTPKLVKDISFLDPSCGSMHFGLVAFDLFVEMYREELDKAGQPGWPEVSSVAFDDDIAANIISNNIYGIDIDLRSVQLSALTLFLKARTLNKDCAFSDLNLACSNVEAVTGGRLEEFISQSQFSHPIYERILRELVSRMKDSDQLGSLLQLEKTLEYLIAEERKKVDAKKQTELPFPGVTAEQFHTRDGIEEFFEILFEQLMGHLDDFVKNSRDRGVDPGHFATEAAKGLRYLRLVSMQYDVVATNPPYMSRRNMSPVIVKHLDDNFTSTKSDLYAAFIARCLELSSSKGKVGMVTQQSFMFIKTYEKMREDLREIAFLDSMTHLGPKAFPNITGEKVNTTAFILCKEQEPRKLQEHQGTYFRLVREKDSEAKRIAFENGLAILKTGQFHPLVFTCRQEAFDVIPGKPWVYWMNNSLFEVFVKSKSLDSIGDWRRGLSTADNSRFIRLWWEIGHKNICFICVSENDCENRDDKWFPLAKGGSYRRWYDTLVYCINYGKNAYELKAWLDPLYNNSGWSRMIKSPECYFREAVTYSSVSSSKFSARITPFGAIFDQASNAIFPLDNMIDIKAMVSILNSTIAAYVLSFNPTINIVKEDIYRIPIPDVNFEHLIPLAEKSIFLAIEQIQEIETNYLFYRPPLSAAEAKDKKIKLLSYEDEIDRNVARLYGLSEEDHLALKAELEGTASTSEEDPNDDRISINDDTSECSWTDPTLARSWISYAFGTVLGRYAIGEPEGLGRGDFDEETAAAIRALIDEDGVMVSEPDHPQDISTRTLRCLELMRGHETAHALIRGVACSDADPEEALRSILERFTGTPEVSFWRHHFQLYRKRPIFWPFQSPKRKFTVWVFQERFTRDTLFKVRSTFADPKERWLEARIRELKEKAAISSGSEKRQTEKEASLLADILDDVQEFSKRLNAIIQKGYTPHIDDGVLINAAPLWELLPSWSDTKRAWQELEEGKYDWAHQAMDHWPDRVREKCKTNKSFAIAHGLA